MTGDAVEREDDVARGDARAVGRAAGLDSRDHHGAVLREAGGVAQPPRHRELLGRDADIGAPHPAVPHQFAEHEVGGVRGDREADALRAHDDGGVDADDLAVRGNQRPAGIARVERRVGLDHVVDQPAGLRAQRAAERGHDAGGHRRFEAERIADGDHELAALEPLGIAQRRRRQRDRRVDSHQGKVGVGVVAHHAGGEAAPLDRIHFDAGRAADHVAVGEHEAVRRDHHAGAGAALPLLVRAFEHVEADHRRADAVDHVDDGAGIGIEQRLIVRRDRGRQLGDVGIGCIEHV